MLERLEARLLLEPEVARLAAERRTDADVDALRAAVAAERAARTGAAAHDASRAFHATIVAATRNDALTSTASSSSAVRAAGRGIKPSQFLGEVRGAHRLGSRAVQPRMHDSWLAVLGDELEQPYMQQLREFLAGEVAAGRRFYPPADRVFNALALTPFDDVRVVILGQDPYHGAGQAMGLCFSVPPGVRPPPSLQNIHAELATDLGLPRPGTGDLTPWAERGVLLLNAVLTVSPGRPASHAGKGWERFTDRAIRELSERRDGIVFLLWGRYAQQKGAIVDTARHHVLASAHPSPYSASSGFFGCCHFSRANALLSAAGREPVDWALH